MDFVFESAFGERLAGLKIMKTDLPKITLVSGEAMIPKSITHRDIRNAVQEIDGNGIPFKRASYRYDLQIGEKRYPPKFVISMAAKRSLGKEYSHKLFNAVEAKNYFIKQGFVIIEKTGRLEKVLGIRVAKEDAEATYLEGKSKYKLHRTRERDPRIGKRAKSLRLKEQGELRCEICDFCFAETYGTRGIGYIEAHHTLPISKMRANATTSLKDIALVCANCHRILHKAKPWLSIAALRKIVEDNCKLA